MFWNSLHVLFLFLLLGLACTVSARLKASSRAVPSPGLGLPHVEVRGQGSSLGVYETLAFTHEKPKFVVVFVPGNPGLPRFYVDFARMLCNRAGATVVLLGLVGHLEASSIATLPVRERSRTFLLNDQVAHVSERSLMYAEQAGRDGVPFVLAGHSIGSWIALRAAQRMHKRGPTSRGSGRAVMPWLLLITPFIECGACMDGAPFRSKHRLWQRHLGVCVGDILIEPLGLLGSVLRQMPESARRHLARASLEPLASPFDALVVNELIHRGMARNLLTLAGDEFRTLNANIALDEELCGMPARLAFVPSDEWAPSSLANSLKKRGLHVDVLEYDDSGAPMKHAFSVQPASSARMATWAVEALWKMRSEYDS